MPARLVQQLVKRGLLPAGRAQEALRIQAMTGGALDTVLLEQGWVQEHELLQALGEVSSCRPVNLADFEPNQEIGPLIPPKIADRLCVVPLSTDGPALHVACGYPVKKAELDEVAFLLGKQMELWVAIEARVRDWISAVYRQPLGARYVALLANIDPSRPPASAAGASAGGAAPPVLGPEPPTPVENVVPQPLDDVPSTPPSPPPKPLTPSVPQPTSRPATPLVEDQTLEDALTAEMLDRLAQSVAEEPIPLEVRKAPRPAALGTPEAGEASAHGLPAEVVSFGRRPLPFPAPGERPPPAEESAPDPRDFVLEEVSPHPGPPIPARGSSSYIPPDPASSPPAAPVPEPPVPARGSSWYIPPAPVPSREPSPPAAWPTQESYAAWEAAAYQAQQSPQELEELPPPPPASPPRLALPALPPEPAKPPPTDHSPPEWSLQEARAQLKEASVERDRIVEVALRYGRRTFDLVAAFAVIRGSAVGWDVRGEGMEASRISQVSIPLDSASVFRTVALSRGSYVGPLPPDSLSKHFLELFGRSPRTVFLFPVEVRSRLVAILYGDGGSRPLSQRRLSDYILFCQDLPGAFQELLVRKKQRAGALLLPEDGAPTPAEAHPAASAATPVPAVPAGLGWSPFAASTGGRPGRAASVPAPMFSEQERPPPDFGPLLRRLTGPDATERARAVAELARTPDASARVLAQNFPGPTAWSRLPVMELPEADELGPVPGALARLGRPAAQALAPLLDADDSDTRYFALLTAGNLPYPELVDGVLRGLFDLEPDISSAARAASTALKRVARFETAMKDLRQELASIDAMRRSLAGRALGVLHDREAIDGLINLTGSDDQMCAISAAEALRDITKATFGTNPRQWTSWWAENRGRRRVEWLVAALRHPDLDIRLGALDELSRAVNDHLGFLPDGPEAEREAAARRWEALIRQDARWLRWDL